MALLALVNSRSGLSGVKSGLMVAGRFAFGNVPAAAPLCIRGWVAESAAAVDGIMADAETVYAGEHRVRAPCRDQPPVNGLNGL